MAAHYTAEFRNLIVTLMSKAVSIFDVCQMIGPQMAMQLDATSKYKPPHRSCLLIYLSPMSSHHPSPRLPVSLSPPLLPMPATPMPSSLC